jgi:hypothetical protein
MSDENKTEFHAECECHTHSLHVEKWNDEESFNFSFWQRGYATQSSWHYRMKCIWYILKNGRPYGDEVIISKKDALKLKTYLENNL